MAALDRGEETFRLAAMLQLLLQRAGTLWPDMQHAVLTFLQGMVDKLTKLRWAPVTPDQVVWADSAARGSLESHQNRQ